MVDTPQTAKPSAPSTSSSATADNITSISTGVSPRVDTPPPPLAPPAAKTPQQTTQTQQQTLQDALERYVSVNPASPASYFKFIGRCTKCGWQTMQLTQDAAGALVRQHVQAHWRDVSR